MSSLFFFDHSWSLDGLAAEKSKAFASVADERRDFHAGAVALVLYDSPRC